MPGQQTASATYFLSKNRSTQTRRAKQMLGNLQLSNFKAFEQLSIHLRPITLLLGPNNSGKSSIIAPIRILAQTLDSRDVDVTLLLNGVLGDFGTYKDVVYGNHRGRPFRIGLSITSPKPRDYPNIEGPIQFDLEYKHRRQRRETILREIQLKVDEASLRLEYSKSSERQLISQINNTEVPSPLKSPLAEYFTMRHFLPYMFRLPFHREGDSKLLQFLESFEPSAMRAPSYAARSIAQQLEEVEYVGAMREPPRRTYLFTGERRRRVGASGEHASSLFMLNAMRGTEQGNGLTEKVNEWLGNAGIAQSIDVKMLSDRHYELRVEHPVTGEEQNFSDVGYGNSQVFPVLVGAYRLDPGSVFLVEEPEIHLHPRAAAELGDLFLDLYDNRVQSVVETHSEHLVIRLQQHVAAGRIAPTDVAVYYVHPQKDGGKQVKRLHMDNSGKFKDSWPEGFFPERLEESKRLSQIRYDRKETNTTQS